MLENTSILNIGGQDSYLEDEFARRMIADPYANDRTYALNELCIHTNTIYQCIEAVEQPEEFNIAKWNPTSLSEVIENSRLNSKEEVSANTQVGKVADALVTKEMIADVAQLNQSLAVISESLSATSSYEENGYSFSKKGHGVSVSCTKNDHTFAYNEVVCTVPEQFRPFAVVEVPVYNVNRNTLVGTLLIKQNGEIFSRITSGTVQSARVSAMYYV